MMAHLRVPFGPDVFETRRIHQREADEKYISLRIGQRSQSVVILLTGCIPESEIDRLTVDHNIGRVVVEDGWDVFAGEGVCRVADQQTCLTHGSAN